ncbi:hypothetical protein J7E81_27720 [Bacillus sp. ISL-18]|uniref:hypothetical protein n=1 Tax=Bacillus sp. ISL-18 TaxID=2819118 RepID=UPI001BE7BFAC|nr:hypothetical protein [Bacillus sp. ISL-18]MBT2658964.1 hypothetical protein [Bacillus sp. ISL-18]
MAFFGQQAPNTDLGCPNLGLLRTASTRICLKLSEPGSTWDSKHRILTWDVRTLTSFGQHAPNTDLGCPNLGLLRTASTRIRLKLSEPGSTWDSKHRILTSAVRTLTSFGQQAPNTDLGCPNLGLLRTASTRIRLKLSEPWPSSDNKHRILTWAVQTWTSFGHETPELVLLYLNSALIQTRTARLALLCLDSILFKHLIPS